MVLTDRFGTRTVVPREELSREAACECDGSIEGYATDSLVFAIEVTHLASDIASTNRPELEVLGTDSGEVILILERYLDHVASITFRLGEAGTSVCVIHSQVVVITHVNDDKFVT